MSDSPGTPPTLVMVGAAGAVCEGDFCEVPAARVEATVKDMLDSGII